VLRAPLFPTREVTGGTFLAARVATICSRQSARVWLRRFERKRTVATSDRVLEAPEREQHAAARLIQSSAIAGRSATRLVETCKRLGVTIETRRAHCRDWRAPRHSRV
jgi:hypothetical protein